MKVKLDENLPEALMSALAALGHDVDNVRQERLSGRSDPDVWQAAQTAGRLLITQDLDFSDARRFVPGTHHGLILLRLRLPGRLALTRRVVEAFERENIASWLGCVVVLSDLKLRTHRPRTWLVRSQARRASRDGRQATRSAVPNSGLHGPPDSATPGGTFTTRSAARGRPR